MSLRKPVVYRSDGELGEIEPSADGFDLSNKRITNAEAGINPTDGVNLAQVEGLLMMRVSLIGPQNGLNKDYTTAVEFLRVPGYEEELYINGIGPLVEGIGNDYVVSESGGVGTGYDRLTLAFAPLGTDNLLFKCIPA